MLYYVETNRYVTHWLFMSGIIVHVAFIKQVFNEEIEKERFPYMA